MRDLRTEFTQAGNECKIKRVLILNKRGGHGRWICEQVERSDYSSTLCTTPHGNAFGLRRFKSITRDACFLTVKYW